MPVFREIVNYTGKYSMKLATNSICAFFYSWPGLPAAAIAGSSRLCIRSSKISKMTPGFTTFNCIKIYR